MLALQCTRIRQTDGSVPVEDVLDLTCVKDAAMALGPYAKKTR